MICDDARRSASERHDGELAPARDAELDAHLEGCAACRGYAQALGRLSAELAAEPASEPDIAGRVVAALHRDPGRRQRWAPRARRSVLVPAAAAFVVAAMAGGLLVVGSGRGGSGVAAADLVERLTEDQAAVSAVSASVSLTERGLHPEVPERRFTGSLQYRAPEQLALHLDDRSDYPSTAWTDASTSLVVDDGSWTAVGVRACPAVALPGCLPPSPEVRAVTGREPFSPATPLPLDLITPVQSFLLAGQPLTLADEEVDGRPTLGLQVTAAQVAPLLDGLHVAGNLRQVHPADLVDVRLDEATSLPLELTVRAGADELRQRWAAAEGYTDQPGDVILRLRLSDVRLGEAAETDRLGGPAAEAAGVPARAAGFTDGPAQAAPRPAPTALGGLQAHRSGVLETEDGPDVHVRTFTDGRAWLSVRATEEWPGGRLFGDLGQVRALDLGAAGVGYLSEDGSTIGLHTAEADLVVTGSTGPAALEAAASGLGVVGTAVPGGWEEAAAATVGEARTALPGLQLPGPLDGFAAPSVRVEGTADSPVVRAVFAGAGDRTVVLTQTVDQRLTPPLDTADVVAVEVQGEPGRYSPERGLLEWVQASTVRSLQSRTVGLAELVAISGALEPA